MKKLARAVVLCSGGASSFRYLYENDPNYCKNYEVVGVFSDVPGKGGVAYAKEFNIATAELDFKKWCEKSGVDRKDLKGRYNYFWEVLEIIRKWRPDFVILSGFMLIVTNPVYLAFPGRILNVHPALLSLLDDHGNRKYRGINTVARAMAAGDPTGSTVHIVNKEPDMGPIVAESSPLPYVSSDDPAAHQEKMKLACDGPAFQVALERLFASGWPEVPWQG